MGKPGSLPGVDTNKHPLCSTLGFQSKVKGFTTNTKLALKGSTSHRGSTSYKCVGYDTKGIGSLLESGLLGLYPLIY